jgi:arsenate reductase
MADVTVYHNPVCGQSRGVVDILKEKGIDFGIVEYLKVVPDRATYERMLDLLPDPPADLVRKDKRFAELGLNADDYTTREAVIEVLLEHPELMQRPVIFRGDKAVLARPSDKVLQLFE